MDKNYPKMDRYYLVKYGTDVFPKDTMVKFETNTYSGRCYLVSDLEYNLKREWIMDYELEFIVER